MTFGTLPSMLANVLDAYGASGAFSYREAGYWRQLSTEEFCRQVRRFCLGLASLGVRPGDAVGLLANPSPFWLIADLAIQSAGAVSVPIFPNACEEHLRFALEHTGIRVLVTMGEGCWATADRHRKRLTKVITKGVAARHGLDWQEVLHLGDQTAQEDPARYARLRDAVKPEQVATIIHTSGSTGMPKGVVLTHRNLVSQVLDAGRRFPLDPAKDRALSCLPLAHVFERMVMYYYVSSGVPVAFADDVKQVGRLLREIRPTVITMVPRMLEKLAARIALDVDGAGALKRGLGHWALNLAHGDGHGHDWSRGMADSLVYRKIRAAVGGRLRYVIVGGAALAPDLARFLTNIGIPIYCGYGLTEAAPVACCNFPGHSKPGTVGPPFPSVEVRIADDGEILVRGPNVMAGYHRDPAATAAAIDAEGWLHTGDSGRFDADDHLVITGRIKELLKTSNGKYVSPVPIELALTADGLFETAMVVAEGRRFVTALLFPAADGLRRLKEATGRGGESDEAFLASDAFRVAVDERVARVNATLDHWEQVRRWRCIATAPTIEGGELTPTLKLRRHVVNERYAGLIDGMYVDAEREPEPLRVTS